MGYLCAVLLLCIAIGVHMERPFGRFPRHYTRWSVSLEGVLCVTTHTFMSSAVYTGTYGQCVCRRCGGVKSMQNLSYLVML